MEEDNWVKNGWLAEEKVPQEKKVYKEREGERERKRIYARTICPTPSYWPVLDCVHGIFERL